MNRYVTVSFLLLTLFSHYAAACGGWILKDLKSKKNFSMLSESTVYIDNKKKDTKIFRNTGKGKFSLINGNRLRFGYGEIWFQKRVTSKAGKAYKYKGQKIGEYSRNKFKLSDDITYKILKKPINNKVKKVLISYNGDLVGESLIPLSNNCANDSNQVLRIMAYFAWKKLEVDPYTALVKNWWW